MQNMTRPRERLSVFLFAIALLAVFVALTFAVGYAIGRMLL